MPKTRKQKAHTDSLDDFLAQINRFRDQRDWRKFHNPKDAALSLVLEAAEVLEHFQWKNGDEINAYLKEHKDHVADELCDVLYWALLMSHDLNIDLRKAFARKMKHNAAKYPVKKIKGKAPEKGKRAIEWSKK